MANQAYARLKMTLWLQGHVAGIAGAPCPKNADAQWRAGWEKGQETFAGVPEHQRNAVRTAAKDALPGKPR